MRESERLAEKGIRLLRAQGWPEEEVEEIVTTLMGAGMSRWAEEHQAETERNEALIKAAVN